MAKTTKKQSVKGYDVQKELDEVDELFKRLAKDKSLPTFGEHFMQCLLFGTAECVNLKKMYPKTYFKLSKWLAGHDGRILAERK